MPQFYLRQFATNTTKSSHPSKQKIWVQAHKTSDKHFQTNIKNVACKNFLYSPIDPITGERNWKIDDRLQVLETLIGKIWPIFVEHEIPFFGETSADFKNIPHGDILKKAISMFIVQLHLRNPYNKITAKRIYENSVRELSLLPKDTDGIPLASGATLPNGKSIDLDLSDWHEVKNKGDEIVENIFLDSVLFPSSELLNTVYKKKWQVIVSSQRHFLTSGRPVIVFDPEVGMIGSPIILPVSPNKCLMLNNDDSEEGYFNAVEDHLPAINTVVIRNAIDQTYSHSSQFTTVADVKRYKELVLDGNP